MKNLPKIQKAIKFAIKTHEVYQKQKRKGKEVSYITHPLTVGLILAHAGASDTIICAGILHDTIEDSIDEKKVSYGMLKERFGEDVANLVLAVTEKNKSLPWNERKRLARDHIKTFTKDEVFLKSADVIANARDILDDYEKDGDQIFKKFNGPKEEVLKNYLEAIVLLITQWIENPLLPELCAIGTSLTKLFEQPKVNPKLLEDYKNAKYVVLNGKDSFPFYIDQKSFELEKLCIDENCETACFITPFNPSGKILSDIENEDQFKELMAFVEGNEISYRLGYGIDKEEKWPQEKSLLLLNVRKATVEYLAKKHEQATYVWYERGGVPLLTLPNKTKERLNPIDEESIHEPFSEELKQFLREI